MLVDQARLVDDLELLAVALLEGERLIDRETELARDHVDAAGEQVGLERGGVLDHLDHDPPEVRSVAPPGRVGLEDDEGAARDLGDPVRPEVEPGVGGLGVEHGARPVGRRVGLEHAALEMRRQQPEVVDAVVVEGHPVDVHHEGLGVERVDRGDPPVELGIADAAVGMAADLIGEKHVVGGHRGAVAPGRVRPDRVGERDVIAAVVLLLDHGLAVLERRQLGAEHADQLPLGVVGGERPLGHAQDVALGRHGIDVGVEGRGELGDPDHQLVLGRPRAPRQAEDQGQEQDREQPAHRRLHGRIGGVERVGGLHRAHAGRRPARKDGGARAGWRSLPVDRPASRPRSGLNGLTGFGFWTTLAGISRSGDGAAIRHRSDRPAPKGRSRTMSRRHDHTSRLRPARPSRHRRRRGASSSRAPRSPPPAPPRRSPRPTSRAPRPRP